MAIIDSLLNIRKLNVEEEIKKAILKTKEELKGLDTDKTCVIYASYLYENLKKQHILCYIVDTSEDLGLKYLHRFVIVPLDNAQRYVLDLTYSQFGINSMFDKIYKDGYQLFNNEMYQKYIDNIDFFVNSRRKR